MKLSSQDTTGQVDVSEASPPRPPPPLEGRETVATSTPSLRVWPGWVAFVLAISASMGNDMAVEDGEQVGAVSLLLADGLLLGSVAWLVWRYVKRWRVKRALRTAQT